MRPLTLLPLALALGGLTLNASLAARIRPDVAIAAGMNKAQQTKLEEVAGASLFGQFRSNMADFLWLKVDKYLHSGVDLRGMTKEEKEQVTGVTQLGHASSEKDGNRAHSTETTVVLSKENDWRGYLGDVERDIKPFMDMRKHSHRDPKEALPLFRLMTWSNPHFIPGYTTGAVMIARDPKASAEALAFIAEGERNNPESIEIQATYAFLQLRQRWNGKKLYADAARHAERGIALAARRDPISLTDDEKEAWQECVRWRVLAYRDAKQHDKATQAAHEGLSLFPQDTTCKRYLREHP